MLPPQTPRHLILPLKRQLQLLQHLRQNNRPANVVICKQMIPAEFGIGNFYNLNEKYTILERLVFPFPHQPSLRKEHYSRNLDHYISFMKHQLDVLV